MTIYSGLNHKQMVIFHGYVSLPEGKCLLMVNMMIDQSMELIIHPQK